MNITSRNLNRIIRRETTSISFKYIEEFCILLECTPGELITLKNDDWTYYLLLFTNRIHRYWRL